MHVTASGLDPRLIEEVLARDLQGHLRPLGADAALVLVRTRHQDRLLVRAPVGLDVTTLVAVGEHASARPGALPALYAERGFASYRCVPLGLAGATAGDLHLLARGELGASDGAIADAARALGPLAFALAGLEAARAAEERSDVTVQVARGLLHQLEISALFPELIRLVARLCPCDAASVAVHRPESDGFELVAVYGPTPTEPIRPGVVIPAAETPIRDAWATGGIVSDPDGRASAYGRARTLATAGIIASLYIPVGEPRRAVLCVGHRVPHRFGAEEIALYRSFVPFLEVALRNAELVGKIRAAYRELEAAQERLVRAERLRALGELAAGVAHDVGNVLAIVGSHAELVAQRAKDDETRAIVESCLKSVRDGSRSVRQVLDLARGADPAPAERARFNLEAVTREAVLLTGPRWRDAGHEIELSGLVAVPDVAGDAGEVREAVVNLLLNAIDATPRGSRIAVATRVEDECCLFAIEDAGPGIPAAERDRVFEPFYTTKGPAHAGLGLSQVARVARERGGSVRVTDAGLGGARFELRFPIREIGSGPHELPRPRALPAAGVAVRGARVLLVEDEPSLRTALSALLALRGHEVVTAAAVDEALAVLQARPELQIVVTDLGLPGRSGWDLVDEVRERWPRLPVIVLSGLGALTDPTHARERGVAAVLAKPTSENDLAATIESLVPPIAT